MPFFIGNVVNNRPNHTMHLVLLGYSGLRRLFLVNIIKHNENLHCLFVVLFNTRLGVNIFVDMLDVHAFMHILDVQIFMNMVVLHTCMHILDVHTFMHILNVHIVMHTLDVTLNLGCL